jgi:hypothetical protein
VPAGRDAAGWVSTIVAGAIVVTAVLVAGRMITATIADWPDAQTSPASHVEPLPVARAGEMAVERARALYGAGQIKQAIGVLQAVDAADPARPAADALRAAWQREVLADLEPSTTDTAGRRP